MWVVASIGNSLLASGSRDTTVRIWDLNQGVCVHVLEGHSRSVSSITLMSNGRLVSGSGDHTLRVWRPSDWACEAVLEGHARAIVAVEALSGGRVVSAGAPAVCLFLVTALFLTRVLRRTQPMTIR